MANNIALLSKSKFPANIFQIMMAMAYAFKILTDTKKHNVFSFIPCDTSADTIKWKLVRCNTKEKLFLVMLLIVYNLLTHLPFH